MSDDEVQQVTCATYTHARRHPMVIGQIGGWTPPFQLSLHQIAVLMVVLWFEYQTWGLWLGHLPVAVSMTLAVTLPCVLAWAVRRARIEGRSLFKTVLGWITLLSGPKGGKVGGISNRPANAAPLGRDAVYVIPGGRR